MLAVAGRAALYSHHGPSGLHVLNGVIMLMLGALVTAKVPIERSPLLPPMRVVLGR